VYNHSHEDGLCGRRRTPKFTQSAVDVMDAGVASNWSTVAQFT
jgi:hypothetical protein